MVANWILNKDFKKKKKTYSLSFTPSKEVKTKGK